ERRCRRAVCHQRVDRGGHGGERLAARLRERARPSVQHHGRGGGRKVAQSQELHEVGSEHAPSPPTCPVRLPAAAVSECAATCDLVASTPPALHLFPTPRSSGLSDDAGGRFAINGSTGVVTVANGSLLDYESAPGHQYSITVVASDGTLTSSQSFTIGVTDVAPSQPTDSVAPTGGTVRSEERRVGKVGSLRSSLDLCVDCVVVSNN